MPANEPTSSSAYATGSIEEMNDETERNTSALDEDAEDAKVTKDMAVCDVMRLWCPGRCLAIVDV